MVCSLHELISGLLIRILIVPILPILAFLLFMLFSALANAIELGSLVIADPQLGTRALTYEKIKEFAVVEGDILIGKLEELNQKSAIIRPKIGGNRWPQGIVPFELSEDLPLLNKLAVLQALIYWQQNTHIEFIELTSKNRDSYPDYIAFNPTAGKTCASFVGKKGGRQEIILAPRCNLMNTVHEIGHALGLWHEQSRADRDHFIQIVWENIEENHRYNFEQHLSNGKDYGGYDYESIMHYSSYAFSKNGEKTIIPLVEGVKIGQRLGLSEKDIAVINAMYPEV